MALGQLSQAECVKMRGQFLRLLDSKTCLTLLNINKTVADPSDSHSAHYAEASQTTKYQELMPDPFDNYSEIFYGEFDGLRRKRVLVKIIGE